VRRTEEKTPLLVSGGRRLTQEELQDRSRRGLCFKCGERWGKDHICKLKNFKLILMEDVSQKEVMEEEAAYTSEGDTANEEDNTPTLSLHLTIRSLQGLVTINKSFKVKGMIRDQEIVMLVDIGADKKIFSKNLAQIL